jgi:hypothetical protein
MTGADIAASMIREGCIPNHAMAIAARRSGDAFRTIAAELGKRSARNRKEALEARERAAVKEMERQRDMHVAMWKKANGEPI